MHTNSRLESSRRSSSIISSRASGVADKLGLNRIPELPIDNRRELVLQRFTQPISA
jgi:hypothetical protein